MISSTGPGPSNVTNPNPEVQNAQIIGISDGKHGKVENKAQGRGPTAV